MTHSKATAIINVHREGALLTPTLRSLVLAKTRAAEAGFKMRFDVVADRADARTLYVVDQFAEHIDRVEAVDYGNLTLSRDHGIRHSETDLVFLHDGDDLYSSNWYTALWKAIQSGEYDDNTVYHTRLFARFGALYDICKIPDSKSLSFDPYSLLVDWYFSNKCVFNRKLTEVYPIPPIDKTRGLGNEDWSWSADTIAAGVRHTFLPETICFYRVKPSHLSLGAVKGVMQSRSPLFEADHIGRQIRKRRSAPLTSMLPNAGLDMIPLSRWPDETLGESFDREMRIQAAFEPLLTQFPRRGHTGSTTVSEKKMYPQLGRFYRRIRPLLGDGEIDIVWMPKHSNFPKDQLLDWVTEAMALSSEKLTMPPLLVFFEDFDDPEIVIKLERWNGIAINIARLDASGVYDDYQKTRFLMRFLLQNTVRHSIDFGAPTLGRIVRDFTAAYSHFAPNHISVLTHRTTDYYDQSLATAVTSAVALARHRQVRAPVVAFAEAVGRDLANPFLHILPAEQDLLALADQINSARFAKAYAPDTMADQGASSGPAILAQMFAAARIATPLGPTPREAGGVVPRGSVLDILSPGAVVNQYFLQASSWLLDKNLDKSIVIPSNVFFRIEGRDHAMYLKTEEPAHSVARFLDMMSRHPDAFFPFALTIRASDTKLADDLSDISSPVDVFTKLAVDYPDKIMIAHQSVVMPDIS